MGKKNHTTGLRAIFIVTVDRSEGRSWGWRKRTRRGHAHEMVALCHHGCRMTALGLKSKDSFAVEG